MSVKDSLAVEEIHSEAEEGASEVSELPEDLEPVASSGTTPPHACTPEPPNLAKKRKKVQSPDEIEIQKVNILQQMSKVIAENRNRPVQTDSDTTFGVQVAAELRSINNPILKTRVKRQIMAALYEAQESELSMSSPTYRRPHPYHPPSTGQIPPPQLPSPLTYTDTNFQPYTSYRRMLDEDP